MSERTYIVTSATIFVLLAMLHLVRLANHWSVQVGTIVIPFWGSWLALIVGVALSFWAFRLMSNWGDRSIYSSRSTSR
ncbi:MAG: hypothetical protein C4288_20715 [Leptolyngbya sp. ERB_1_1]